MDDRTSRVPRSNACSWHPRWLEKSVLAGFVLLFLILAGALVSIDVLANHFRGFSLSMTKSHYVWTYGPTVILVVVVGLWRRVNYCVLVNQPWHELSKGPQPAERTVLLDYLWPLQITSFFMALKYRHFAVASSIAILTLLKAIIVVSTTLFFLRDSVMSRQAEMRKHDKFTSTAFWNQIEKGTNTSSSTAWDGDSSLGRTFDDARPTWQYSQLQSQYQGTSPPDALSKAFTNFSAITAIPGMPTEVRAEIELAEVEVTCESPTVDQTMQVDHFSLGLKTPSCEFGSVNDIPGCTLLETSQGVIMGACGTSSRMFYTKKLTCTPVSTENAEPDSLAYFAVIAAENDFRGNDKIGVAGELSVATCRLGYSLHRALAHSTTLDSSGITAIDISEPRGQISNFTSVQLLDATFSSLNLAQDGFRDIVNKEISSIESGATSLLGLMSYAVNTSAFETFLNASTLKTETKKAMTGVGQQILRSYLVLPDEANTTVPGSVTYLESRLHTRPAALWGMVALFFACACLGLVVAIVTRQDASPQSPAKLKTSASVLARSPVMMEVLVGLSTGRSKKLRRRLSQFEFMSSKDDFGRLSVQAIQKLLPHGEDDDTWCGNESHPQIHYSRSTRRMRFKWMPWSAHKHAVSLTILLPLAVIVILEILHRLSANREFVTLSSASSIAAYAIEYTSTATVLLVASLINTFDFAIATMTPFSALASRGTTQSAEGTMFFSVVEDLPPVALYKALRFKHPGAALSLLASTIGSVLTIVVSGLWFYNTEIHIPLPVTAQLQSDWQVNFTAATPPTNDGVNLLNEIASGVLVDSEQILADMVFPSVGNSKALNPFTNDTIQQDRLPNYIQSLTALQPSLDCSSLPSEATQLNFDDSYTEFVVPGFNVTAELPDGCHPSNDSSSNTIQFRKDYNPVTYWKATAIIPPTATQWLGWFADLDVIADAGNDRACPSLGAFIGFYDQDNEKYDVTSVICTQRIRSMQVNATFSPSNLPSSPDTLLSYVDLNQSSAFIDSGSGLGSLSYKIRDMLDHHVTYKGVYLDDIGFEAITPVRVFGQFLAYLMDDSSGIPIASIVTPRTKEELLDANTLINSINHLYQQLMLHVLDLDLRKVKTKNTTTRNLEPRAGDQQLSGTTIFTVARLKINATSKTALQIMLSAMAILGGLAYWLVDMRGILPRNPYPIASSMALFEGSRLLEMYRDSRNDGDDMVRGKRFRLGWWSLSKENELDDDFTTNESAKTTGRGEREQTQIEGLDKGTRFGIDVMDDGLCQTGWALIDKQTPRLESLHD